MNGSGTRLALRTSHFQEANELIRQRLDEVDELRLDEVLAQRYLGCAMPSGKRLSIYGTPGNDMAAYLDGGRIEVFGNAQDQIGNTMNAGEVIIHGRCGDAAGYAMRGGSIFIRDDCGWRVGINMKQYGDKRPAIVIGGDAGSFLGEYMAGGAIVLLGHAGDHLGTGMHGGVMYLKHRPEEHTVSEGLMLLEVDEADRAELSALLQRYQQHFAEDAPSTLDTSGKGFFKLVPASSRPYASMYVP